MRPIRVLIIEDSSVIREFLTHIISSDPRLAVAGTANSAEEGLRLLRTIKPDVISMDIRLPGMNGFEATRKIMSEFPTPVVVVSASVEADDLNITMNALKAGALAVVEKPVGTSHEDYEALSHRLCTQLAIMSQVRVVRQRFNQQRSPARPASAAMRNDLQLARGAPKNTQLVALVASTGGPSALQAILSGLPLDFPAPLAVVQHISASFHEGFVAWLNASCALEVSIAHHLQIPEPGHAYVAPPDYHLTYSGGMFRLTRSELVCSERPSGTVLFESLAKSCGREAIGVLLTGMGADGAQGLSMLRAAGGFTIAEAETTAVVNGMPGAARQLGAVCESLPLELISSRLQQLVPLAAGVR